jgi:putative ATP-binding cassette transporter
MAAVVFALPQYFDDPHSSSRITYVAIFLFATVNALMRALPMLARADAALAELDQLERQLAAYGSDETVVATGVASRFDMVRVSGVLQGGVGSRSNEFDLELRPGEQVLITGGNGSGKTTLLRLLTALYSHDGAAIEWNGAPVANSSLPDYRGLFAAVFDDCHVFDRVYGMDAATAAQLPAALQAMGLSAEQVKLPLSEVALGSTSRRRRVALAIALLDARPILVLDDILAGQDDPFREYFVSVLLPGLRAAGTCVLMTPTSADQLGDRVDRLIRLDGSTPPFAEYREATL